MSHPTAAIAKRPKSTNFRMAQSIDDPAPDFAKIAQGFGVHAEGPIDSADAVGPALRRALRVVKEGRPAVVDVLTRL